MKIDNPKSIILKPGDHLGVVRSWFVFDYVHHGIYIGRNKIVQFEPQGVTITTTKEFFKGKELHLFKHRDALPREIIVSVAKSFVDKGGYNLFLRNCEHLATFCTTGKWDSHQSSDLWPGEFPEEEF